MILFHCCIITLPNNENFSMLVINVLTVSFVALIHFYIQIKAKTEQM